MVLWVSLLEDFRAPDLVLRVSGLGVSGGVSWFSSSLDLSLAFISSLVRNVGGLIHSGDPIICSGLVSLILLSGLPLFGV